MTPEAKKLLAETIRGTQQAVARGLRARLLDAIHSEAERRYRLAVPIAKAGLDEAALRRRERLEQWIEERARATKPKNQAELEKARARFLLEAEKEAAATFLNRLILVRQLEALGLSKPAVVTGGWNSRGYREFRDFAPALTTSFAGDETEGYGELLKLLFDELAYDLPGLFGDVGLTQLFPIPPAMLRETIERLDDPALASVWTDDTTLGWVYQYWNDPDREALDAKINGGGKIEPHEIASKTQMFTERYMVEWLLQNSLGPIWLSLCKRRGWVADAEGVLPVLEVRREEWRRKREAGEVALDELMPIEGELEERWKYYVPQPLPKDHEDAPSSIRELRLLEPACGSGHFLVTAFDLLAAMYREEARHTGTPITEREIAESILENNLFGIDIDPRAIQIAAAALYLKAKRLAKDVHPRRMNLIAPAFHLGALPEDDPAVKKLREVLWAQCGIPEQATTRLLRSLSGVDHLGSLLQVDASLEEAIREAERFQKMQWQEKLFEDGTKHTTIKVIGERQTILDKLSEFLANHYRSDDLGLRLDGEQFAAGVRFVRMTKEGTYDLVVGNPPYQGLSKAISFDYVAKKYPRGKPDLYAAFLERGLQLAKKGGISALLTMRGWMFLGQFAELRKSLLREADLRMLCDVDRGAFEDVPDEVLSTVSSVIRKASPSDDKAIAMQPTPPEDRARDALRTARKRAAVLLQVGRHEFDSRSFAAIEGEPIVYWWNEAFLKRYAEAPKLGETSPAKAGAVSGNHVRFLRLGWELEPQACTNVQARQQLVLGKRGWVRYVKGARGRCWIDPCDEICNWRHNGLEIKVNAENLYGAYSRQIRNEGLFFQEGIAVAAIGASFSARAYRWRAIFDNMAASVFPADIASALCTLNASGSRAIVQALNPGIHFEIGDVNRLPVFPVENADEIYVTLDRAFTAHEAAREASVEFQRPGHSAWRYAQNWAQRAVDREAGEPLPPYEPDYDPPAPEAHLSFAVGIALGRFDAAGKGIRKDAPDDALPSGILFVSAEGGDSLEHPACSTLAEAWKEHGATVGGREDLSGYLRRSFFAYHRKIYENRPIYFPLSSSRKSFVAFVSIHSFGNDTLNVLLADYLVPTRRRLEGELEDLRIARVTGANKARAERRFAEVQRLLEELSDFIEKVTEIADYGPPCPDVRTPAREVNARFVMDLDDGVMVNSAAMWPLLEPQWKDPKKWWKELATAEGRKDYDWSHLAARYFPTRVRRKCEKDPSLAVAHGCFWELHPARAYAWELRLQDELGPHFRLEELGAEELRARFLAENAREAREIEAAERKRRARKAAREEQVKLGLEGAGEGAEEAETELGDG